MIPFNREEEKKNVAEFSDRFGNELFLYLRFEPTCGFAQAKAMRAAAEDKRKRRYRDHEEKSGNAGGAQEVRDL